MPGGKSFGGSLIVENVLTPQPNVILRSETAGFIFFFSQKVEIIVHCVPHSSDTTEWRVYFWSCDLTRLVVVPRLSELYARGTKKANIRPIRSSRNRTFE
jgi:hypothetical protein